MVTLRKRGFTLIELLVVIAIIALLSSVVFAAVSDDKKKALATQFTLNIKQLGNAVQLYMSNAGDPPAGDGFESDGSWDTVLGTLVTGGYVPKLIYTPGYINPSYNYTDTLIYYSDKNYKNRLANAGYYKCGDVTSDNYIIIYMTGIPAPRPYISSLIYPYFPSLPHPSWVYVDGSGADTSTFIYTASYCISG